MSEITQVNGSAAIDRRVGSARQDELLLCSVLESLAAPEARFAADLGNAGQRKLRHAFEAIGAVYRAQAVGRVARLGP